MMNYFAFSNIPVLILPTTGMLAIQSVFLAQFKSHLHIKGVVLPENQRVTRGSSPVAKPGSSWVGSLQNFEERNEKNYRKMRKD